MRKNIFGRQFKRDTNERTALFKGLVSSLVLEERIKTTEEKAKAIRAEVEKLVTKARKGGLMAHRLLQPHLTKDAVKKMILDISPRFDKRNGGYTRIVRLGERFSDNASMVYLEWVEKASQVAVVKPAIKKTESKIQKKEKKTTGSKSKIVKKQLKKEVK